MKKIICDGGDVNASLTVSIKTPFFISGAQGFVSTRQVGEITDDLPTDFLSLRDNYIFGRFTFGFLSLYHLSLLRRFGATVHEPKTVLLASSETKRL
jgi:hypothetical protein